MPTFFWLNANWSRLGISMICPALVTQLAVAGQVDYDELSRRTLVGDSATLEFQVEWKSDLSSTQRKARTESEVALVKQQWLEAGRSEESFKSIEAQLRIEMGVVKRKGKLLLSYSPNRFYYEFTPEAGAVDDPKNRLTLVYYNGVYSYRLLGRGVRVVQRPEYKDIEYFPLVGLRFWHVTLFRKAADEGFFEKNKLPLTPFRADVYWFNSVGGSIGTLVPGFAEGIVARGKAQLKTLYSYSPGHPFTRIDFSDYKAAGGNWIAHKCRMTTFVLQEGSTTPSKQAREHTDYKLTAFRPEYNGFSTARLVERLRNGDPLVIEAATGGKAESMAIDKESSRFKEVFRDDSQGKSLLTKLIVALCSGVGMLIVIVLAKTIFGGQR